MENQQCRRYTADDVASQRYLNEDSPTQVFWHLAIVPSDQVTHTAFACILSDNIQSALAYAKLSETAMRQSKHHNRVLGAQTWSKKESRYLMTKGELRLANTLTS